MKQGSFLISFFFSSFIFTACKLAYQPQTVEYVDYQIRGTRQLDSSIVQLVAPYADSVNKSMNQVVAHVAISLDKKQPEGTLNNVVADAMLQMAKKRFSSQVDAAFVNFGGVRLTQIPAGPLTKGKIFELSPFDNAIVLLTIPGNALQDFLDLIAARGGWPVAGIRMNIRNKKATNIVINGNSLDTSKMYTIATIDYVANGGDNANMLISLQRRDVGYLFRDALIDYFSTLNKEGKSITAVLENRTTIAE